MKMIMRNSKSWIGIILLLLLTLSPALLSQNKYPKMGVPTPATQRLRWFEDHLALKKKSIFDNLKWRFIGPRLKSGRVTDIAVPKGMPYVIYAATSSGGVWKTTNEGTTWMPIFDREASSSIGAIAVSNSDSDVVWVGTGENNSRTICYPGTGVYKSVDGGRSWKNMGLIDSHEIGRIIIHPNDSNTVYIAVLGPLYSFNKERGIYKTTDGGKTWKKVLFIDEKSGFIDLVMDPSSSEILYAASWERVRRPWNLWPFGPGSGIYKTTDGGKNWRKLTGGFPDTGREGRIGLSVSASNPNIIYALFENHNIRRKANPGELDVQGKPQVNIIFGAEVYRSDNKGDTWRKVNKQDLDYFYWDHGFFFGQIRVDPHDEDTVYILGQTLRKSVDGGKTYLRFSSEDFGDFHAMWIDPGNSNHVICGDDHGLKISYDGGKAWRRMENIPVTQFYFVNVDMEEPFNVFGSAQDYGNLIGPITNDPDADRRALSWNELRADYPYDWKRLPGGEADYLVFDPTDGNILYHDILNGDLYKTYIKEDITKHIKPKAKEGESKLRTNWTTPFIVSPHNPLTLYYGAQYLFRSVDRGETWQRISPDLTMNNPEEKGNIDFATITTISESPLEPGLIFVGTDDGNVQVTNDGGAIWQKITKGLPGKKWVSRVYASALKEGTVYLSLNGFRDDDFNAYIYKSVDFGNTWMDIKSNLPCGPVNVIKEDPKNKDIIYVGTDIGVYISVNGGRSWDTLQNNMPAVSYIHDLVIHPRDNILVVATHGRGMYAMDVSPIQKFNESISTKDLYLYEICPIRYPQRRSPQEKAVITYYMKKNQAVSVSILDSKGFVIKKLEATGDTGFNQIIWDLKTDSEKWAERFVRPGVYVIRIEAGAHKEEQTLELK